MNTLDERLKLFLSGYKAFLAKSGVVYFLANAEIANIPVSNDESRFMLGLCVGSEALELRSLLNGEEMDVTRLLINASLDDVYAAIGSLIWGKEAIRNPNRAH